MKKVLLIAAVAGLAMVSCKKDYVCECTNTSSIAGSTSSTSKHTIVGVSKGTAKANCIKTTYEDSYTVNGTTTNYTSTSDCKLK